MFLLTLPRYEPSRALSERAEIIGHAYKQGEFSDTQEYQVKDCLNPTRIVPGYTAMVDDFGEDKEKEWDFPFCAGQYATKVKDETEKMFPVSSFKDICEETQGNPTGHLIFHYISFFYFQTFNYNSTFSKQSKYFVFLIRFK